MHSNVTERLLNVLIDLDPIYEYKSICEVMSNSRWKKPKALLSISEAFLESATLVVAYLLALVIKVSFSLRVSRHHFL